MRCEHDINRISDALSRLSYAFIGFLFERIAFLLGAQESPRAQRNHPDPCTSQALRIRGGYGTTLDIPWHSPDLRPTAPGRCQLATVSTGAASFATFCTRTEVALANVQEFADPERFRQQIKPDQKEMRRGRLGWCYVSWRENPSLPCLPWRDRI